MAEYLVVKRLDGSKFDWNNLSRLYDTEKMALRACDSFHCPHYLWAVLKLELGNPMSITIVPPSKIDEQDFNYQVTRKATDVEAYLKDLKIDAQKASSGGPGWWQNRIDETQEELDWLIGVRYKDLVWK